jgi:hypothetical protein
MRLLFTSALATAMLFFSAATAGAVSFTFQVVSGGTNPGDSLTLDLYADPETENLQAWFLQVTHVGNTASAAAQEAFIFAGGALASPLGSPVPNSIDGGNATGQYAFTVSPPGSIPAGTPAFKFGSISFASLAPGDLVIEVAPGGAVGGPGGVDLVAAGLVTFDSITIVPEPSTALLVGLGLLGLGVAGRRK